MASITPSQPSNNGADIEIGSNTYIVREFTNLGHLSVRGTVQNVDTHKSNLLQRIKEKTGGVDPVYIVTSSSTPYEVVRYYFNELHLTDVIAIHLLLDNPAVREETPKNGYKAGNRFLTSADIYAFARAVRDGKLVFSSPVDWNSWITSKIVYEAEQEKEKEEVNADPNSPYNPKSVYYVDGGFGILKYDKATGYIIYQNGKLVDTKAGLTYLVEAQGGVKSYDLEKLTITYESGAVLDLKTMKLTTSDGVIQITEQNPQPWYFKVFGKLLTDTKTQMMVLGVIVVLLILKKRHYE